MKRFLASLLGVVVFFLLVGTCTLYIAKDILSANTLNSLVEVVPEVLEEEIGIEDGKEVIEEITSAIEDEYPGISEYFDVKEFKKELVTLVATGLENLGNPEANELIDTTSFKKYIEKTVSKYEKETKNDVDDALIQDLFDSMDEELYITKDSINLEERVIFEIIFSNKIIVTLVAGIVLCTIIIFILLGKIQDTLSKVKTPFLINGAGAILVGIAVNNLISGMEVEGTYPLAKVGIIISTPFFKVAAISIIIGIALMLVAKVLKNNRSIENSNNAIENLGNVNYTPNNNITNTPYNGYQNH